MNTAQTPPNETVAFSSPCVREIKQQLKNEIKGVDTWFISLPAGEDLDLSIEPNRQVIYFTIQGSGTATTAGKEFKLESMSLFVPKPGTEARFSASSDTTVLKIEMDLRPEESASLNDDLYPMFLKYADCEKYRDYFKSEKTVSRTLVHPFTLPRFCMGSVETTGPDRIEPHAHPMLDQLFFSFSNNSCSLLIDGETYHYGGNNLLHIPLGSDHGVDAVEGDVVHYLWLDFFDDAKEMQYLVEVHKPVED